MSRLFLIFNHKLTGEQEQDARVSLGVERMVELPRELKDLWGGFPPEAQEINPLLGPVREWLASEGKEGDFVLIQGDFGATYLMVNFAFELKMIPVYATTKREAKEERQSDGSTKLVHRFKHTIFRRYGA